MVTCVHHRQVEELMMSSLQKKKIASFGQSTSPIARDRASATLLNVIHLNVSDL